MSVRAVFYDEDDVRAAAAALARAGHRYRVERLPLAGEDDDEDHPWALASDAPRADLEALVARHDGWLDHDTGAPGAARGRPDAAPAPVPLPTGPRRHHRPPGAPASPGP